MGGGVRSLSGKWLQAEGFYHGGRGEHGGSSSRKQEIGSLKGCGRWRGALEGVMSGRWGGVRVVTNAATGCGPRGGGDAVVFGGEWEADGVRLPGGGAANRSVQGLSCESRDTPIERVCHAAV